MGFYFMALGRDRESVCVLLWGGGGLCSVCLSVWWGVGTGSIGVFLKVNRIGEVGI